MKKKDIILILVCAAAVIVSAVWLGVFFSSRQPTPSPEPSNTNAEFKFDSAKLVASCGEIKITAAQLNAWMKALSVYRNEEPEAENACFKIALAALAKSKLNETSPLYSDSELKELESSIKKLPESQPESFKSFVENTGVSREEYVEIHLAASIDFNYISKYENLILEELLISKSKDLAEFDSRIEKAEGSAKLKAVEEKESYVNNLRSEYIENELNGAEYKIIDKETVSALEKNAKEMHSRISEK